MIELSETGFCYGKKRVLDQVSLKCRKGELTGIVGPNGCGKTTLLRIMAGYLVPLEGEVRYEGRPISSIQPRELATLRAVVEQRITSPFEFSVYEYVMLGRTPYFRRFQSESDRDRAVVHHSLNETGTLSLKHRSIGELSGGELQRVMIARALAQEPMYLMLDEPTAHLDINHQLEIMEVLRHLSRTIAVIAVVHDLNLAKNYCDRIAVLREGRMIASGGPEEILDAPRIREIFSVSSVNLESPAHNHTQLAFHRTEPVPTRPVQVHLFGGGGCAARILYALHTAGVRVSAGVLNEGDRDLEIARSLGCEVVTAPPFSRISREQKEAVRSLCGQADAIVIAAMPVGEGNLGNLEVAVEWLGTKPVLLYHHGPDLSSLDYTGGKGEAFYHRIGTEGRTVRTPEEILDLLDSG